MDKSVVVEQLSSMEARFRLRDKTEKDIAKVLDKLFDVSEVFDSRDKMNKLHSTYRRVSPERMPKKIEWITKLFHGYSIEIINGRFRPPIGEAPDYERIAVVKLYYRVVSKANKDKDEGTMRSILSKTLGDLADRDEVWVNDEPCKVRYICNKDSQPK